MNKIKAVLWGSIIANVSLVVTVCVLGMCLNMAISPKFVVGYGTWDYVHVAGDYKFSLPFKTTERRSYHEPHDNPRPDSFRTELSFEQMAAALNKKGYGAEIVGAERARDIMAGKSLGAWYYGNNGIVFTVTLGGGVSHYFIGDCIYNGRYFVIFAI
jgi:hypothetical protein